MASPVWLHGEMKRPEAEALLSEGEMKDGKFLVRKRPGHDEYVLAVIFRGRVTHHLITRDESSGVWLVNRKKYGDCKTIEEVIQLFQKPCQGWPVILGPAVPSKASSQPDPAPVKTEEHKAAPEPAQGIENKPPTPDDDDLSQYPYFHDNVGRPAAEELIKRYANQKTNGVVNGVWLMRRRPVKKPQEEGKFNVVITVGYQSRITHHLVDRQPDGTLTVNTKPTNGSKTLKQLMEFLKTKPKFWPVDMRLYVPSTTGSETTGTESAPAPLAQAASQQQQQEQNQGSEERRRREEAEEEQRRQREEQQRRQRDEQQRQEEEDRHRREQAEADEQRRRQREQEQQAARQAASAAAQTGASSAASAEVLRATSRPEQLPTDIAALRDLINSNPRIIANLYRQDSSQSFGFSIDSFMPPMVTKIASGGPAHVAGVQPEDIIVRLAGKDVLDMGKGEVPKTIKNAGTEIKLLLLRPTIAFRDHDPETLAQVRRRERQADLAAARSTITRGYESDDDDGDDEFFDDE